MCSLSAGAGRLDSLDSLGMVCSSRQHGVPIDSKAPRYRSTEVYSLGAAPSALQKRCGSDHGRDKHGAFAKSLVLLIVAIWRLCLGIETDARIHEYDMPAVTKGCLLDPIGG